MAAIAIGVLVFTGVTTLVLTRRDAEAATLDDLRAKAPGIAEHVQRLAQQLQEMEERPAESQRLRTFIGDTLRLSRASVVTVEPDGSVVERFGSRTGSPQAEILQLPEGVAESDLDAERLLAGREQTGVAGDVAFVARPLNEIFDDGTPILVLTGDVNTNTVGRAVPFFVIASILAIGVAVLMAYVVARRLTKPLAAMQQTAVRIAGGDLSARVGQVGMQTDEELAGLARTLDGMAAELEAARDLERRFLLSVSHDLRTPLTSIMGYAAAIAEGAVTGRAGHTRAAEIIAAEARRLERLVTDLVDLARLDAHQFSLTPRPVDAGQVVRATVDAFRLQASEIGITLGIDGDDAVRADTDPERLGQIVANLVENALNYARSRVAVGVSGANGSVQLQVVDDGPGIDPDDLPRVFDRLYTSRTVPGRKVGTGLGLAIVRELAAAMGGSARVEAVEGTGTRFAVSIPASRA